jgi:hypothetical protein
MQYFVFVLSVQSKMNLLATLCRSKFPSVKFLKVEIVAPKFHISAVAFWSGNIYLSAVTAAKFKIKS